MWDNEAKNWTQGKVNILIQYFDIYSYYYTRGTEREAMGILLGFPD